MDMKGKLLVFEQKEHREKDKEDEEEAAGSPEGIIKISKGARVKAKEAQPYNLACAFSKIVFDMSAAGLPFASRQQNS